MYRRIWVLLAAVSLLWSGLGWRLYELQVADARGSAREAVAIRMLSLPLAERGRLLDRDGRALTDPQPRIGVAVFPPLLTGRAEAAARLAPLLGQPADALEHRLAAPGHAPYWLATDLDPDAAGRISALGLPGVAVAVRSMRHGPASLAHHLTGYVNVEGGKLGLEATWDPQLAGEAGPRLAAYQDAHGQAMAGLGVRQIEVRAGKYPWDLHLTLDARVQGAIEAVLDQTPSPLAGTPLRAAVVVLDVETGAVVALASRPDFDPNQPLSGTDPEWAPLLNRTVQAYPPGSIFKPLVAAYAVDRGLATLDDPFDCPGHYDLGDRTYGDSRPDGHGHLNLREAIVRSCNITFIRLGYERMGGKELLAAAAAFGLGEPTGLALFGEEGGRLPELQWGGEVAQLAFGQGLYVTPLQVARAYAALARDGVLPGLRLVEKFTSPAGEVMLRPARLPDRRAVSAAAARQVAGALREVTDPDGPGTGHEAWVKGWGSAGKTGTAQTSRHGRLATDAWFAGWVPRQRPQYVIVVLVEDGSSGGDAAAPLFRRVAEQVLAVADLS